jgi:L-ribulose-5-phosphate 3-epimerase
MVNMQNFSMNPIGIYEKAFPANLNWDERLSQAAKAGYDFVEMSIDDSDERLSRLEWTRPVRLALRHSIENSGVPILSIGVSGHRKFSMGSSSQDERKRGLEILYRTIELANDLGARLIQLMGYDVFYEKSDAGTQARFLEALFQGVCWASAAGVMLGLENVDVDTVDSVEKALRFVQEVNSPWLNLYPDIGNLVAAGFNPVEQLKLSAGYLVGVHVKDALPGEVRGVVFEKGNVQFSDVFQTLAEMGFSGPMVVEMWANLDTTGDPSQVAAEARQLVARYIQASFDNRSDGKKSSD